MMEFIRTGDFRHIQLFVTAILAMWFLQVLAVCVDFWAGTNAAKALGQNYIRADSDGVLQSLATTGELL